MNKTNNMILGAILGGSMAVAGFNMTATEAHANSNMGDLYVKVSSVLNLRKGPDTNTTVLAKMPNGAKVQKMSNQSQNGFYKVKYTANGKSYVGYASGNYLTAKKVVSNNATATSKATHVVNADGVRVRTGAGTSFTVVTKLNKGDKVEAVSSRTRRQNNIEWREVKVNGRRLYIADQYLTALNANTTTTTPVVKPESNQVAKPEVSPSYREDAYEGVPNVDMPGFKHTCSENCIPTVTHVGNQPFLEVVMEWDVMLLGKACTEVEKVCTVDSGTPVKVYTNVIAQDRQNPSRVLIGVESDRHGEITGYIPCYLLPSNTGNAHIDWIRGL